MVKNLEFPNREAVGDVPPNAAIMCSDYVDFLSGMATGGADLILTDPPYAISRDTGFASGGEKSVERFAVSMDFGKWDRRPIDLTALSRNMHRVLRKGGTAIVWYDLWKLSYVSAAMAAAGFKMLRLIVWQKTNPVPLNMKATYLSNSREVAVVGVKGGKPTFHGKYDNGIYEYPIPRHNGRRIHPTQKPLDLFVRLVEKHSNAGDLIIDPFLGGGTTAVAACNTERNFAGCDINQTYVTATRRRLQQDL